MHDPLMLELVSATTPDGMTLHGAFLAASDAQRAQKQIKLDAAILLHGAGTNFYSVSFYRKLTPCLLDLGLDVFWTNNRGHDGMYGAMQAGRYTMQGAAFEHVGSARHDIAGWLEMAAQRNLQRILVIGHSLGAIKTLLAQAYQPDQRVAAIIACSPPCLSYERFVESEKKEAFMNSLEAARQEVAQQRPHQLVQVDFPFPMLIAAENYLDKYGPGENYNIMRFTSLIKVPTLFTFGERELSDNVSFYKLDQQVSELVANEENFQVQVIPGADHFYTGTDELLSQAVSEWLRKQ